MKKIVLIILFLMLFNTSNLFAAQKLPITGYWVYQDLKTEKTQSFGETKNEIVSEDGYSFYVNETGAWLTDGIYYINSPGSNVYHRFCINSQLATEIPRTQGSGQLRWRDDLGEVFWCNGIEVQGAFYEYNVPVKTNWGWGEFEIIQPKYLNMDNISPKEYTLETIPADGIYIDISNTSNVGADPIPSSYTYKNRKNTQKIGGSTSKSNVNSSNSIESLGPGALK